MARPPAQINLGELMRSIETDFFLVECLADSSAFSHIGQCGFTRIFNNALGAFMQELNTHALADVLPRNPRSHTVAPPTARRLKAA
jgi:Rrf2 family nitric oxide-sensitive transcriptional repressor